MILVSLLEPDPFNQKAINILQHMKLLKVFFFIHIMPISICGCEGGGWETPVTIWRCSIFNTIPLPLHSKSCSPLVLSPKFVYEMRNEKSFRPSRKEQGQAARRLNKGASLYIHRGNFLLAWWKKLCRCNYSLKSTDDPRARRRDEWWWRTLSYSRLHVPVEKKMRRRTACVGWVQAFEKFYSKIIRLAPGRLVLHTTAAVTSLPYLYRK